MESPLLKKVMKGPKCWKGYVAKGKKKSPSGKRDKNGDSKKAETPKEHLALKEKGYNHDKRRKK